MDLQWKADDLAWGEQLRHRLREASAAEQPLGDLLRSPDFAILQLVAPVGRRAIGDPSRAMIAMRELGRALALAPEVESFALAGHLLFDAPSTIENQPLAASDQEAIAVAWHGMGIDDPFVLSSVAAGEGWRLNGSIPPAIGAGSADVILVAGRCDGEAQVFRIPSDLPGLVRRPFLTIDGQQADELRLKEADVGKAALVARGPAAERAVERGIAVATTLSCARAVGMMRYLVDATVEYLLKREQFNQPLARFQALQHRAVDMLIETELAESASLRALLSFELDEETLVLAVAAAKATVAASARFVGQSAIQLHGGKGMDSRTPATDYFRALTAFELSFGSRRQRLAQIAELTLDQRSSSRS